MWPRSSPRSHSTRPASVARAYFGAGLTLTGFNGATGALGAILRRGVDAMLNVEFAFIGPQGWGLERGFGHAACGLC
jgi:hypothetical protein